MQYAAANNTSQQQVYDAINGWLAANPDASQADIVTAMDAAGVDIGDVVAAMSSKVTADSVSKAADVKVKGKTDAEIAAEVQAAATAQALAEAKTKADAAAVAQASGAAASTVFGN
jgi:hypothetical protein